MLNLQIFNSLFDANIDTISGFYKKIMLKKQVKL